MITSARGLSKRRMTSAMLLMFLCCFVALDRGVASPPADAPDEGLNLDTVSVNEWRGYYKREHSLIKPYQGSGMDIPYWDIVGSTMVSGTSIKLTADQQSRQGAIWNRMPVYSRDWELQVSFKVQGTTGELFGDGLAIWYTQERSILGPVFGSKDYFRGLAVFLDTYSNHNGPHGHGHPYISAMVANGSAHYDHDRDGTHTQLGGEHTGCESKFRNKEYETQILIRYVGDAISVWQDIRGKGQWEKCFVVGGVRLPTGYYIGLSAATGDLHDSHEIISVRMFEQEYARAEKQGDVERHLIEPMSEISAAPRDHVTDPKPSKLGWFGTIMLVLIAIVVIAGALGFGLVFLQKRQEMGRKRFY